MIEKKKPIISTKDSENSLSKFHLGIHRYFDPAQTKSSVSYHPFLFGVQEFQVRVRIVLQDLNASDIGRHSVVLIPIGIIPRLCGFNISDETQQIKVPKSWLVHIRGLLDFLQLLSNGPSHVGDFLLHPQHVRVREQRSTEIRQVFPTVLAGGVVGVVWTFDVPQTHEGLVFLDEASEERGGEEGLVDDMHVGVRGFGLQHTQIGVHCIRFCLKCTK